MTQPLRVEFATDFAPREWAMLDASIGPRVALALACAAGRGRAMNEEEFMVWGAWVLGGLTTEELVGWMRGGRLPPDAARALGIGAAQ